MDKPAEMFDRDFEWGELTRFAALPGPRATLGVVSGRRRQGKSFLLDAVTRASGGFMFTATETTEADALRQFGEALARHRSQPTPFRFAHWDEAVTELMRIADRGGPTVAVIDEFPFLAKASPALPSIIQRALDPAAQHTNTPVRLLLCGSALSFMGGLLAGNAPLRGRAGLELVVPTLDFRLASEFWEITDPHTALLTHAIVGGTPAYRREFTQGDAPAGPYDFDAWAPAPSSIPPVHSSARPATCSQRNPNSTTPRSTTPSWPPSPPATPHAAASPTTSAASPPTSPTRSASSRTSA
ncbi:hypothetical protein [Streptomyces sp. ISL-10]|uniref:AAA family ATPase n=1 Tax=Streptomyces sp. ISL-10 TaxID=2819172 RepID=UPI0027E47B6C|nr:hypothetical protein [Streptomyces sp. ISL-10]